MLLSPPEIEPKTKTQWKKFLRNYNRGPLAPSTRMTSDDAEGILRKLKAARLRPSWNWAPIADIYVPKQSNDYPKFHDETLRDLGSTSQAFSRHHSISFVFC